MKVRYLKHGEDLDMNPSIATIGFFDGVHLGHQFLLNKLADMAQQSDLEATVITFDRHPRQVLQSDYQPKMLSTLDEKLTKLQQTRVDNVVVIHFDKNFAQLSARIFMEMVLKNQLNVKKLIMGYDNRFGHNRSETFEDYVAYGQEIGMEVMQSSALTLGDVNVSSSVVRRLVERGDMEAVQKCLGTPYIIKGKVVNGFQNGRKLGFPTANIEVDSSEKMLPPTGVYAVKVVLENDETTYGGMLDIGTRPTFNGKNQTIEVNIFDFEGDLYGSMLSVSFVKRLRDDVKFDSIEALIAQLHEDKTQVISILNAINNN